MYIGLFEYAKGKKTDEGYCCHCRKNIYTLFRMYQQARRTMNFNKYYAVQRKSSPANLNQIKKMHSHICTMLKSK